MYLKFYGLKESPFNVTSDPTFLYLSRHHQEALNHLVYGIRDRKGFLQITGEIGAGKTTLCKALLDRLGSSTRTAFILHSSLSELQLLEAIVEDFGLTPPRRNRIALLRALNVFLLDALKRASNAVLILDEAQALKVSALETIRQLSNLETHKDKLLQIVLVGQPELRRKLDSPRLLQLRQRIAIRYHIEPLEEDEIERYVYHRLTIAGSVGDLRFTDGAFAGIFDYSGGIPRLINLACDKALLLGFVVGTRLIDAEVIARSILELEGKSAPVKVPAENEHCDRGAQEGRSLGAGAAPG